VHRTSVSTHNVCRQCPKTIYFFGHLADANVDNVQIYLCTSKMRGQCP
ncbi:26606_t:CDS:1, partial [Racocetra persica]